MGGQGLDNLLDNVNLLQLTAHLTSQPLGKCPGRENTQQAEKLPGAATLCGCCHLASATIPSFACANAPHIAPSCSRSLVPNASRCSIAAMADSSAMRTLGGMAIRNTNLRRGKAASAGVLCVRPAGA